MRLALIFMVPVTDLKKISFCNTGCHYKKVPIRYNAKRTIHDLAIYHPSVLLKPSNLQVAVASCKERSGEVMCMVQMYSNDLLSPKL